MKIAKTLLKILAWCVGVVFALGVAIYLVVIGINWNDQPASEASIRLERLGRDGASIPDEDNAYVYVVGFTVAPEEDPSAWGTRRLAWALVQPPSAPVTGFPGENHDFKRLRSKAVQELFEACRKADAKCLGALEGGDDDVAAWLAAEGWLLARYKTLLGHKGWRETVPWDARVPLPEYSSVLEGQKLLLLEAWTLAGQGNAGGVNKLLEADVRFWRHTLAATNNLISNGPAAAFCLVEPCSAPPAAGRRRKRDTRTLAGADLRIRAFHAAQPGGRMGIFRPRYPARHGGRRLPVGHVV